jgi:hypothetical protein
MTSIDRNGITTRRHTTAPAEPLGYAPQQRAGFWFRAWLQVRLVCALLVAVFVLAGIGPEEGWSFAFFVALVVAASVYRLLGWTFWLNGSGDCSVACERLVL